MEDDVAAASEGWTNVSLTVTVVDVLLSQPEPKTTAEFLKYSHEITLDANTTNTSTLQKLSNPQVKKNPDIMNDSDIM